MKALRLTSLAAVVALAALLVGAGCGAIDLSTGGNPDRVLNGTVNAGVVLPAGAEVLVRLIAPLSTNESIRPQNNDMPVTTRSMPQAAERVLGAQSQTLTVATQDPVPFRIEYNADDAVLRRGLNVEARISVNGKVRFRTINSHVVTLASSPFKQDVTVQATGGN